MSKLCLYCGKELNTDNLKWHRACIKKMFNSTSIPEFSFDSEKEINENLDKGSSVTGVQKKFSLSSTTLNLRKIYSTFNNEYIIKTQQKNLNNIVYYEWLGMKLATICGINTVECGIIESNNELLFITKRIDRINNKKVPMEDFCQLSNTQTEYKYNGSYEKCYKNVIKKFSNYETLDKIYFYKIILFSYIIGNTDMHLKNFSLYEEDGKYRMTPAYDLVPVLMVFNQEEMALTINGKNKNLTKKDFYAFGASMGIQKSILDFTHNSINKSKDKMINFINHTELSDQEKRKFIDLIEKRINEVCD